MNSRAVRLYGKHDLRLETFPLRELEDGELLLKVVSSAICTSCYKVATLGEDHHRVPDSIQTNPVLLGHEFSAEIVEVTESLSEKYVEGESCVVQPMAYIEEKEVLAVGHSFDSLGGYATYVIVPKDVVGCGAVVKWRGNSFYKAALAEPLACIIAAWRSQYHTHRASFKPVHGAKKGGRTLLLGGTGAMGFLTSLLWQQRIEGESKLYIYGSNEGKIERLRSFFQNDARVSVLSSENCGKEELLDLSAGEGFDDIVVFASSKKLVSLGLDLLAYDGCLNMFAGPFEKSFSVEVDFHAVHYKRHHIVGSSGASEEDLKTALSLLADSKIDPTFLITHIGGLDSVAKTVCNLPAISGGKKLIYPHLEFPLIEIAKIEKLLDLDQVFQPVVNQVVQDGYIWSDKAESVLLNIEKINK